MFILFYIVFFIFYNLFIFSGNESIKKINIANQIEPNPLIRSLNNGANIDTVIDFANEANNFLENNIELSENNPLKGLANNEIILYLNQFLEYLNNNYVL